LGFLGIQQLKSLFPVLRPQFSMQLVVGKMPYKGPLAVRGAVVWWVNPAWGNGALACR